MPAQKRRSSSKRFCVDNCPCKSGLPYPLCCAPYHEGALPKTAEALMRSRYSAYALGKVSYIIETTHPNLPVSSVEDIEAFCQQTQFENLEILDKEENAPFARVTFRATLSQRGQDVSFTEKSTFEKVQGKWLYLKGETI